MPRKRGVRVVILVEDETLECFARNALARFGHSRHKMRVYRSPLARNAKQWVTQQYPGRVQLYRRNATEQVALLVGTDADEQTMQQRHDALDAALRQADMPPREWRTHCALDPEMAH